MDNESKLTSINLKDKDYAFEAAMKMIVLTGKLDDPAAKKPARSEHTLYHSSAAR